MKKFYQFGLAMLLIGFCKVGAVGQIACKDSITVALSTFGGTAMINVEDVVVGTIPAGTVLSGSNFNCDDVGSDISITATSGSNVCFTNVTVLDLTPPVAVADLNVEIVLPQGSSEIILSPELIDDGSYDLCSDVILQVIPPVIDCSFVGKEIQVTLEVIDASGNFNSAVTNVFVSGTAPAPLECISDFEISIIDEFQLTLEFLRNSFPDCAERTFIVEDENGNEIIDGILNTSHIGQTVTSTITQLYDNATCSTAITVVAYDCIPFEICDTDCNDAPLGDCNSGHTETDNGEWPCDLSFPADYPGFEASSPDALIANFGVAEKDARPQIFAEDCQETSMAFQDEIFYIENSVRLVRTWTVLEWHTFYVASYAQEIVFTGGGPDLKWNICDTESNETEVGDCESGHTDGDDVEWPADITVNDHRVSENELRKISGIPLNNTRPIFVANEDYYHVSYIDQVLSASPEELIMMILL